MAELYQSGDRVVLDVGEDKREVLFSVEIADWCADGLVEMAGKAAVSTLRAAAKEPTIEVDAIVSERKPMVRLRFGRVDSQFYLTSQHAVNLATWMRVAARKAETMLKWAEERDPAILLR